MNMLFIIILILFLLFVGWVFFALCYISGEVDEMEQEIYDRKKEELDDKSGDYFDSETEQ